MSKPAPAKQPDTPATPTFAAALRARLDAEGLSGRELARQVGVVPQAVSLYMRGQLPSPSTAARIRAALPGLDVPERGVGKPRRGPRAWPVAGAVDVTVGA